MYSHGITFGGHPVQAAIALKNIEIMRASRSSSTSPSSRTRSAATLAQLLDLPIVGDLRGTGFFYALELVKDKETRETFSDEECERLLRGFLSPRLFEAGLICRADDRGDPVIQISPPLIAGQAEFDEIVGILGDVLDGGLAADLGRVWWLEEALPPASATSRRRRSTVTPRPTSRSSAAATPGSGPRSR